MTAGTARSPIRVRGSVRRRTATGHATGAVGLPAGTEVFSADDHISLAEDIFYERFPESMKEQAPRVVYDDGAWTLAIGGKRVPAAGVHRRADAVRPAGRARAPPTSTPASRELESDGIHRELAFPNALLGLMGWPDKDVRERCFRIYNEHIAELQEQSGGRFYGVGMINWWDGDGARRTLAEMKDLGLKTFWLPLKPGKGDDGKPIDYNSPAMYPVWEAIEESGLPVAHHIGESPLGSPCADNSVLIGMVHNVAPFREMFGRYVFGGILDRHPGLTVGLVRGRHQLGPRRAPGRRAPLRLAAAHGRPPDRARRRALLATTTCTPRSWSTRSGSS